ncbi:MAG TPA: DUF72 domain-containing protein [Actinomycetota bacterium]|nr:DUF72 domain-containing protein [Actinomycetota bacterium]
MSGRLIVGTSGFAYADWKPRFYPEGLAQSKFLPHYATRLSGVEINYTFSRFPTAKLLDGWAAKVPPSFVLCLKTPKLITHQKRLRACETLFAGFAATAGALGPRLGPLLVQLPPTMPADAALLRDFLAAAPPSVRLAFEFRDPSWDSGETREALAQTGAAWVVAETGRGGAVMHRTADFVYLRLRRDAYDTDAIDGWITRIAALLAEDTDVFCFLRHDADGANAVAAERMIAALTEGGREQHA